MSVRVFAEGGGDRAETKAALRAGFGKLFSKIAPSGSIKVVVCGGRSQTIRDFRIAVRNAAHADHLVILLDSEEPLAETVGIWAHLKRRDRCDCPAEVGEENAGLMVMCMESWFLADAEILQEFYGQMFGTNALPGRINVEEIPKGQVQSALERATRNTQKGSYHKTKHGPKILELLRPAKVRERSAHFARLCDIIERYA